MGLEIVPKYFRLHFTRGQTLKHRGCRYIKIIFENSNCIVVILPHNRIYIRYRAWKYTSRIKKTRKILHIHCFQTWLCLGIAVILMGPTLFIIHRVSPFYDAEEINREEGLSTIHNCLWYVYGALLQQGKINIHLHYHN